MSALLMEVLVTSCGRLDLLTQTLNSLQSCGHELFVTIHEDSLSRVGQHKSIQIFLMKGVTKYYLHLEDDWVFENHYDWISESINIMDNNPNIIKVLARKDMVHPCEYNIQVPGSDKKYGILEPWKDHWEGFVWHGFGFNPGVTRLDLLKRFIPFPEKEQQLSEKIYQAGYKTAALEEGVYYHIGEGRSTHK